MRTRLRTTIDEADLKSLGDIHRRLQELGRGMHPASGYYPPLFAAIATVQQCGSEWSGRGDIWRERDKIEARPNPGNLK